MSLTSSDAPKTPKAAKPAVALGKVTIHDKVLELKVKLNGETAVAFTDYARAYLSRHGDPIEHGLLAAQMIAAFIDSDKGFAAWRKTHAEPAA